MSDVKAMIGGQAGQAAQAGQASQAAVDLARAVKAYAAALQAAVAAGEPEPPPFPPTAGVTATEVLTVSEAMLRAADLDVFEVQIWRSMRYRTGG